MIHWEVSAEIGCGRSLKSSQRVLELVGRKLKSEQGLVFFYLVTPVTMKKINRQTRGKNQPTNVLSFPAKNSRAGDKNFLGEVFLCPAEAHKRGDEPAHLIIHGILHLFGYTHENTRDTMEMEKKEDEILDYVANNYRT